MQFSKEGSNQQSYPVIKPMNHNNDQLGMITLRIQEWHTYLGIHTNSSLIGFQVHSTRRISYLELETLPATQGQ